MNFGPENFLLIIALQAIALCLFIAGILLLKNRKLQRLVDKLKLKAKELRKQLKESQQPQIAPQPRIEYSDYLDQQLELTKEYHYSLGSRQDIALDLDPDVPLPRRAAALRHAILISEKEATSGNPNTIQWDFLATRYQQLLSFTEDYTAPSPDNSKEDLEQTREELLQARKRINNLERFKTLYLELEERWEQCKGEATEHFTELKNIAANTGQAENFQTLLESYHSVYNEVGTIIQRGADDSNNTSEEGGEKHYVELQQLRTVAADQHRIISELKNKLEKADSVEEQIETVGILQDELQKQARFLQESETCIQLMEDELNAANGELVHLRKKINQIPEIKSLIKDQQEMLNRNDQTIDSLKTENRRLAKKLKLTQEAPTEDSESTTKLRKELLSMQSKYNDLEEKFLNLKLKD